MSEPSDPKQPTNTFETSLRVADIEIKSFTSAMQQLESSMASVKEEMQQLETAEEAETLEITLGEAGLFIRNAANAYARVAQTLETVRPLMGDSPEKKVQARQRIESCDALLASLRAHLSTVEEATQKLHAAKQRLEKN